MSRKRSRARVGAKLRKARERCGLSLRQIADSTKISVPVLEALERDEITYLPGGVLGRGYVRSFAAAVKLDPEVIVAELVAQFPESSVKDGYPPAERIDGDAVAEAGSSRRTTKIRLYDSGRFTRIASIGVIAVLLAGVIAFAAPKRWAPWTTLPGWGTNDAGPTSRSAHEHHLKTLDARAFQLSRPFTPPTLPSRRALPRVGRRAMPSKGAAAPTTATAVAPEPAFVDDESAAGAKTEEPLDPNQRSEP